MSDWNVLYCATHKSMSFPFCDKNDDERRTFMCLHPACELVTVPENQDGDFIPDSWEKPARLDKETVEKMIAEAIENFKKSLHVVVLTDMRKDAKFQVEIMLKSGNDILSSDYDCDYIEKWQS